MRVNPTVFAVLIVCVCVCVVSQETDNSVRLKIASLLGLLAKTQGFNPDCIVDDAINSLSNESMTSRTAHTLKLCTATAPTSCLLMTCTVWSESHQVLAQLLETLLLIGSQLADSPAVRPRLVQVACKVSGEPPH